MHWQERLSFYAASLLLIVLCAWPLVSLIEQAVAANTLDLFARSELWTLFARSLVLAVVVTGLSLVVGVPLGVLLGRFDVHARGACVLVHAFPLFLPPFLLALGWFHLLGRGGLVTIPMASSALFSVGGAIGVLTLALAPIVTSLTMLALQGADPVLEEAARIVAGPLKVAIRILTPIAAPSIALAALIVFALAFSELGVPMFLRVDAYPAAVFARLGGVQYAPGEAFMLVAPLLAVAIVLVVVERTLIGERPFTVLGARRAREPIPLGAWRGSLSLLAWLIAILGLLPLVALLLQASRGGGLQGVHEWIGTSVQNSLLYAGGATALMAGLGAILGHALARKRAGSSIVSLLALLAFITPAAALGVGLIETWNRPSTAAIYGTSAILILGLAARYSAISVRGMSVAFSQTPRHLEEAAALAGASYFLRLRRIVLPLHARALGVMALLTGVFCLRDLETAVLIYPAGSEPLTVRIFTLEANGPASVVAALCVLQVVLTAVVVSIGLLLVRERRL